VLANESPHAESALAVRQAGRRQLQDRQHDERLQAAVAAHGDEHPQVAAVVALSADALPEGLAAGAQALREQDVVERRRATHPAVWLGRGAAAHPRQPADPSGFGTVVFMTTTRCATGTACFASVVR